MVTRRTILKTVAAGGAAGVGGLAARTAWRDREPAGPPVQDAAGHLVWRNWSGLQHAYPAERAAPDSEEKVLDILAHAPTP